MILKKYIMVILMLLSMVEESMAANINITGKVTHGDPAEPLEFATVRIAGTAIGVTTDLDGKYAISAPEADTITVIFSCIGFHESKRQLVNAPKDMVVNVKMLPKSTELSEVQITELRKQTDGMQRIASDSYRLAADVSGGSVESLITTLAGVNSSNEMSSQYSVRGGSYDENSVYINGIEVYRPQLVSSGQQEGLSIINPDMVGSIGFSTGGFSAEYGDKMSSVLDIAYREPQAMEGSASLSLMGGSVAFGQSSKAFSQMHGLRYKRNSSLLSSMDTHGEYDPNFFDYQTSLNFKALSRLKISFLGNVAINNYKFRPVNRQTNFGTSEDAKQFKVYFDGHEKDRFETFFGALSVGYRVNRGTELALQASGYLTNELVAYDISGEYWLDQAGSADGTVGGELGIGKYKEHARNRLRASVMSIGLKGHTALGGHTLGYGVTFNSEKIMDRTREWEMRDSAGYSLPSDGTAVKVIYNLASQHDISTNRMAFFVQDTYKAQIDAGILSVNGGIRCSYWDYNREFLVSPRASVGFIPSVCQDLALRFSTGLYYQAPFYKEYRLPVEDADGNIVVKLNNKIKSQQSLHFILGSDYTFRAMERPFKVSAEAYYKKLDRLVPYEIDNLKITYSGLNQSHGYAMGLDFKLFGQFVPGSDSWLSFSLMKTQENLHGVKVPRPSDQRYSVALFFTDFFPGIPRLKFNLRGILNDGLPVTPPQSTRDKGYFRTPPYKRIDIGLSYALVKTRVDGEPRGNGLGRVFKSAWIGLDVFNLLDISNVSSYYWVTDVNDIQYAVPNYLTRRQVNVRLTLDF